MKNADTVLLIGIGGAGINTVNRIQGCNRIMIDSECASIEKSNAALTVLMEVTNDVAAFSDSNWMNISAAIDESKVVVICAGVGGNIGSNLSVAVAELAKKQGKFVVAVLFKPFAFEGEIRNKNAIKSAQRIHKIADCTICIANDKIRKASPPARTLGDAFLCADRIVEKTVKTLEKFNTEIASKEKIVNMLSEMFSAEIIVEDIK